MRVPESLSSAARDAVASPIGAYRRVIQDYPLLSREQERELFVLLELGEESARERLLLSNVRLAIGIARRYAARCHLPLDDIIQEAMFGLLRAVEGFDHRTGHRFSTYATMAIQNTVASALDMQLRTIRIPT